MIKKKILFILFLTLNSVGSKAQSDTTSTSQDIPVKKLFIDIGYNYSSFQDIKYSNVQSRGTGLVLNLGFSKKKDHYLWETIINFNCSRENASTHQSASTLMINPIIYFKYLRPLKNGLLIGGRIDALDFYFRQTGGLGNNSNYFINGHHLYGSLIYNKKIHSNWNLQSNLDIGLISFMKESTSFAFSAPQNGLESGEFDYQNDGLSNPFGYKYFDLKYIGNNLNIKTSFLFQYKKRFSIGYYWSLKHFSNVKSYPVTVGLHSIVLRYNIIHKRSKRNKK